MDILLIAGLWLPHSIWSPVVVELERLGHRPVPVALPGVDVDSQTASLDDQLGAVLAAVDDADRPFVVGHSAACTLAWMAADRRPDGISRLALIGGFPAADGEVYADMFEMTDGRMAFPGWEPFEGPDSDDLDQAARRSIEEVASGVPELVAKGVVRLTDERRYDMPTVLVCPEFTPEQAKAWIDGGDVPELGPATNVSFVDIESGHWPMVSKPRELAELLDKAAG